MTGASSKLSVIASHEVHFFQLVRHTKYMIQTTPAYSTDVSPLQGALVVDPNDPNPKVKINPNNTSFANAFKDAAYGVGLVPRIAKLNRRKRRKERKEVFEGKRAKTSGGLTRADLIRVPTGHGGYRIVHKKKSALGRRNPWILATTEARKILKRQGKLPSGHVLIKKGTELYDLAVKIQKRLLRSKKSRR